MVEDWINCGNTKGCKIFSELEKTPGKNLSINVLIFDGKSYRCDVRETLMKKYPKTEQCNRDVFNLSIPCHVESSLNALYRIEEKLNVIKCLK